MKSHGPWKIKDSEEKYKNPWIEVREDQVVRPDDQDGIYGVVTMKPGVSVLAIDENNEVYLTREFSYAIGEESLEVVSGGIDEGENPLEAAKRELKEELGIEAQDWVDLGLMNPFTKVINSPAYLFMARDLTQGEMNPEGTEQIEIVKVAFDEAVQMVQESKITHGQSSLVILKAQNVLK